MINQTLKQLGFNDKEVVVYLEILKTGKATPADISKTTGLNRTTVYSVTEKLVRRGVIAKDLGSPNNALIALPPADLEQLVKKQEKKLEEEKKLLNLAIEQLKEFTQKTGYPVPKIVFIPEKDLNDYLYKQTPVWDKSMLQYDGIWWGFQDFSFVRHYEKWIDWYWETGSNPKTSLKLISNSSAESIKEKKFERREIRFWGQSQDFTSTIWINGDYIIMIVTSQQPHYLVEIHDKVLAHNLREMFKGIWGTMTK